MFKNYFKTAWRNITKNRMPTSINIAGLSIGMTAAVLIMFWVKNELTFDSYHPDAKKIFHITYRDSADINNAGIMEYSPLLLADAAKNEIPEIEKTARLFIASWATPIINIKGALFNENKYAYVDDNWFNMFHYHFIEGNVAAFLQNPFSVILTKSKAKIYFGNRRATGETIIIDSTNYQVQAVVEDEPANSSFQFDMLLRVAAYLAKPGQRALEEAWYNPDYITFVQLRNQRNSIEVVKKLNAILARNSKSGKIATSLLPLTGIHFEIGFPLSPFLHGSRKSIYIFSVLAILLLLIACINYVNLATARSSLRAREVSIRKIVGAERMQLFGQFIGESILISLMALLLTLIFVHLCLPLFNTLTEKNFVSPLTSVSLWQVLAGTLCTAILLNGIYPAILLSSFNPLNVFRGITIPTVKDVNFRKILVIIQFTISIILIVGTIVIFEQLNYIQQTDANYNRAQIFCVSLPIKSWLQYSESRRTGLMNTVRQELLLQSSIEQVSLAGSIGIDIERSHRAADWDGRNKDLNPYVESLNADESFQKLFDLTVKEGRWFVPGNQADRNNYILNETAEKEFNIRKPVIGQRFIVGNDTGRVIGIVKDFHYASLHNKIGPLVIINHAATRFKIIVKANPVKITQALLGAKSTWNKIIPDYPFNFIFLNEAFDNLYRSDKKTSTLVFIFSGIGIFISVLGLFGLAAFTAALRNREIAVRKVLGATVANITVLLSKDFVKLVIMAIIIASPIALWVMNKWLHDFAYRINISWWVFVITGLGAVFIALVTVSLQAIKAAIANPVNSLRME